MGLACIATFLGESGWNSVLLCILSVCISASVFSYFIQSGSFRPCFPPFPFLAYLFSLFMPYSHLLYLLFFHMVFQSIIIFPLNSLIFSSLFPSLCFCVYFLFVSRFFIFVPFILFHFLSSCGSRHLSSLRFLGPYRFFHPRFFPPLGL